MSSDSEGNPAVSSGDPRATRPQEQAREGADLLGSLECEIQPVRKSPLYHVGSSIVAVAMVILPLLYVCLVALVCYLTYLHATRGTAILTADEDARMRVLVYFGPLIVGGIVALFMIKPLFARAPKGPPPYSLNSKDQPLLFEYTRRLSRLTGSPAPRRIDLDCNVNASASFRRGWRSMFGNDLVLTIGLPLVEGMTLRQLTGVLAHEFGHFSQGGAMRLSYVIRSVSFWFARVVYERDRLDIALHKAAAAGGPWFWMLILAVSRGAVWLTRRVLWVFMAVGHVISSFLLRQMEYDADRYQARVAGSEEFEKIFYRMTMLSIGQHVATQDLGHFWEDRKLPDRIPELVAANADLLTDESQRNAWKSALARRAGRFDTHPSDSDRIESARRENAPGVVREEAPARRLFENYPELTLSVTKALYRDTLRIESPEKLLVPTATLLEVRNAYAAGMLALRRFFCGRFHPTDPVFLNREGGNEPATRDALIESLKNIRREISSPPEADEATRQRLICRRFELGLHTLRSEHTAGERAEMADVIDLEAIGKKIEFLEAFEPHLEKLNRLSRERHHFLGLLSFFDSKKHDPGYAKKLLEVTADCWSTLSDLKKALHEIDYPYADIEKCTCESVAFEGLLPAPDDIAGVGRAAGHCEDSMARLHARVVGELTLAAERVETVLGLPPLSGPPQEDRSPDRDESAAGTPPAADGPTRADGAPETPPAQ
jgi:hypothetical protein